MSEADIVEIDLNDPDEKEVKIEKKADAVAEAVKKPEKRQKVGPTPDEVIANLKKDLESERNAKLAAEKRARDEAADAETSKKEVGETQLQLVTNAISTLKADSDRLESDYDAAFTAGDGKSLAKIQRAMAETAAKLLQLENGKTAMEDEAKREKEQPRRVENTDPVEAFASSLTARSADWIRKHPEFVTDKKKNMRMVAAHNLAMADDIAADSEAYFQHVEKTLNIGQDDTLDIEADDSPMSGASSATSRRSPPAAPVTRNRTSSGGENRTQRATLTKEEAEVAEMNGMTPKEYWEHKQALKTAGRMN